MDFEEEELVWPEPPVARVPFKLLEVWRVARLFGLTTAYLAELVDEDPELTPAEVEALRADAIAKAKRLQQTRYPRARLMRDQNPPAPETKPAGR